MSEEVVGSPSYRELAADRTVQTTTRATNRLPPARFHEPQENRLSPGSAFGHRSRLQQRGRDDDGETLPFTPRPPPPFPTKDDAPERSSGRFISAALADLKALVGGRALATGPA